MRPGVQRERDNQRAIDVLQSAERYLCTVNRLATWPERALICRLLLELLAERREIWDSRDR